MSEPIAICTLSILAVTAICSWQGFRSQAFQERFIFEPAAILRDKQYFRLVTSGFLHADWMHFLLNAISLYSFGKYIELLFGIPTLMLIYFGSIVGGSLLSLYLHRHHDYRALGASGGVCGVIFASIFLLSGGGVTMLWMPVSIPSWLYAILFLVASFIGMKHQLGNIGHDAHLGGALIGLLITTALHPEIVPQSPILYATIMALATSLFLYLWLNPLFLPAADVLGRGVEILGETRNRLMRRKQLSEDQEMDRLLEEVSQSGIHSLSTTKRKRLDLLSQRRRER